jgi:hypothetical protein
VRARWRCDRSRLAPTPAAGRGGGVRGEGLGLLEKEEEKNEGERERVVVMSGARFKPSTRRWGTGQRWHHMAGEGQEGGVSHPDRWAARRGHAAWPV